MAGQRQFDYEGFQDANPKSPLPGDEVNQDLDALWSQSNTTESNLGEIQGPDLLVAEAVVNEQALTPEVRDKLNTGGSGGSAVTSVNGQQGEVILRTSNIPETDIQLYLTRAEREKIATLETGAQVNRPLATEAEAEAGTDNSKSMSPLRTSQAIAAQANIVPDFTAEIRDFDQNPLFNSNVTYNDYTQTGPVNIVYGPVDPNTWINGCEQSVRITGNGDAFVWEDGKFVDRDTGATANITVPESGETVTYNMRWLQQLGVVSVRSGARYIRTDGLFAMEANLDMGGFNLLNVKNLDVSGAARAIPLSVAYAASIQLDLRAASKQTIAALTGNLLLSDPLNIEAGRGGTVYLDNRGAHTVTFGAAWRILDGQDPVVPAKECILVYDVPYNGTIAYSRRELN